MTPTEVVATLAEHVKANRTVFEITMTDGSVFKNLHFVSFSNEWRLGGERTTFLRFVQNDRPVYGFADGIQTIKPM